MELTQAVANLKPAVYKVWYVIGYDAEELCDGDNECAVEMCIDAGRLSTFADDADECALREAIETHGYTAVLEALSKEVILV
jgi:hypothetical protein